MKIVLKRRKHRNGVRPTRKGTLKVRMVELITRDQHHRTINKLMDELHPIMMKGIDSGLTVRENHHAAWLFYSIKKLKKGYDYFEAFNQIDPAKLAYNAINEVDPIYEKPTEDIDTCATCEHRNNCPFADVPQRLLYMACPIKRGLFLHDLKQNAKLKTKPLTTSDMANLALQHLS